MNGHVTESILFLMIGAVLIAAILSLSKCPSSQLIESCAESCGAVEWRFVEGGCYCGEEKGTIP